MRLELVGHPVAHVGLREQHDRRREPIALAREDGMVEIVKRYDQSNVVLADELDQRGNVPGVGDERRSAW